MRLSPDERWTRRYEASQRRLRLKQEAVEYMGGKCVICGYTRCFSALEFHHLDPNTKDFAISAKMSWETIRTELDKTILVCSNCHKEIHAGLHPSLLEDHLTDNLANSYNQLDEL